MNISDKIRVFASHTPHTHTQQNGLPAETNQHQMESRLPELIESPGNDWYICKYKSLFFFLMSKFLL